MNIIPMSIQNDSTTQSLKVDIYETAEVKILLPGEGCGIEIQAENSMVFVLLVSESQILVKLTNGVTATFCSLFASYEDKFFYDPKNVFQVQLRNSRSLPLEIMQEPWGIERKLPSGEFLLFEALDSPQAEPLSIRWLDHILIVEGWIPPEDEIVRTVVWY